jgi:hypothetical protein
MNIEIQQKLKYYAKFMHNCQYDKEYDLELSKQMVSDNIFIVHGSSDDIMSFGGAIYDESYDESYVTKNGLYVPECEDIDCPHENKLRKGMKTITPLFCQNGLTFSLETNIQYYESFTVMENDDIYGIGYVFSLDLLE